MTLRPRRPSTLAPVSSTAAGLLVATVFAALLAAERRWPLRRRREPAGARASRNLAMAALSGVVSGAIERPVALRLAARAVRHRRGVVQRLPLPDEARTVVAVVLLDYTLYLWHVLTHRVPRLWCFHAIHHADRDLDVTTAVRFHVGEMVLSIPFRAAQVRVIGASPRAVTLWQTLLLSSMLFHHSNLRLSERADRWLSWIVVTPRLHGIHHAVDPRLRESNWSNVIALWDVLHGTRTTGVPQPEIGLADEAVPGFHGVCHPAREGARAPVPW
jgi:sterol desaturase/sphingolipid hydroxylase (fatty acid hydroxylase superfamily)